MNKNLSEIEIDDLVVAQAEDEDAWEEPIFASRKKSFSLKPPIKVDKAILSGTPVFEGTRVPVSALLDNLEAGASLNEFIENFPTVKREQAVQVLEYFKSTLDEFRKAA
jgi:uncharacterized protein (DUF433 family)